jgi:hypothetical protein
MGKDITQKRDYMVVRDSSGLLHAAQLYRKFDDDGALRLFQVSTACAPTVKQYTTPERYTKAMPEQVEHGGFLIVEWRVRENPTCLTCVVTPNKGLT